MNTTKKAIVIATGQEINVYKTGTGLWCNAWDCTTTYTDGELRFI